MTQVMPYHSMTTSEMATEASLTDNSLALALVTHGLPDTHDEGYYLGVTEVLECLQGISLEDTLDGLEELAEDMVGKKLDTLLEIIKVVQKAQDALDKAHGMGDL